MKRVPIRKVYTIYTKNVYILIECNELFFFKMSVTCIFIVIVVKEKKS